MKKIIVFVLLLAIGVVVGCGGREEARAPGRASEEMAGEQEGKISTFTLAGFTKGGKKKWEIEGKSADIFSNTVKLDDIIAKAYGDEGRTVVLTADAGNIDKRTNNIHLEKNVVATTEDGAKLTTNYLDWLASEEKVVTQARVKVQRENLESTGSGAEGTPGLKNVVLKKDVVVKVKPMTVVTCTGPLNIDYEKNIGTFHENVRVTDPRGHVLANEMDVYFDPKTQKVVKVVARGNVRIIRGGNTSYSKEAVYLAEENKVTLIGRPRLVIYEKGKWAE